MFIKCVGMFAVLVIGGAALFCFCKTKRRGFGAYTSSTLLLIVTLTIAGVLALGDVLQMRDIASILIATIGFAAGVFTKGKD